MSVPHHGTVNPSPEPHVTGYVDQHGGRWICVTYRANRAFLRVADVSAGRSVGDELTRQGVVVTTTATRNSIARQAEAVEYTERLFVLDGNGWLGAHYVWAGVTAPPEVDGVPLVDDRPVQAGVLPPGGSMAAWRREVAALADGQALPTFALCCAFAGILCRWVDGVPDNPLFDADSD